MNNTEIAEFLSTLAGYYGLSTAKSDSFKATTFAKAADYVRKLPVPLTSGAQLRGVRGLGASTEAEVNEFLQTGTSERLQELQSRFREAKATIEYFRSFHGIGPVKAIEFYQSGWRTWSDLWLYAPIHDATLISIYWHEHTALRIPRSEMDAIQTELGHRLNPYGIKWIIAGSYRREESSSGDIDILIERQPDLSMAGVASLLQDLIPMVPIDDRVVPSILAQGEISMFGILRLDEDHAARRFDVKFIDPISYPYALLHFTGSGEFNVLMRRRAIELGLTLNEYTMYNYNDSVYNVWLVSSEEEIFRNLGVHYTLPYARTRAATLFRIEPFTLPPPTLTFEAGPMTPHELMTFISEGTSTLA